MRERPILFSSGMVRAILDGRKTQTRRLVKPQPHPNHVISPCWCTSPDGFAFGTPGVWCENGPDYPDGPEDKRRCPFGVPGDRLWVKETYAFGKCFDRTRPSEVPGIVGDTGTVWWAADVAEESWANRGRWRPSIHMPRWASRITLEVTEVRVERLQDISEEDARAEGAWNTTGLLRDGDYRPGDCRHLFRRLWDGINGERAPWRANPWVWVVGFRRVTTEAEAGR